MTTSTQLARLPACPTGHTPFTRSRRVRIADSGVNRKLRLDGVARYIQDLGFDHLDASPDGEAHPAWIVRRSVIDVIRPISFGEHLTLRRWASATSTRWCNIRIQLDGSDGGLVETESFLIHFDIDKGVPARMSDAFLAPMLESTDEHRLKWRPMVTAPPSPEHVDAVVEQFVLRTSDLDFLDHVNNSAYLQIAEDVLAVHSNLRVGPYRTIVEYEKPIVAGEAVTVSSRYTDDVLAIGISVAGQLRAALRIEPLPDIG